MRIAELESRDQGILSIVLRVIGRRMGANLLKCPTALIDDRSNCVGAFGVGSTTV